MLDKGYEDHLIAHYVSYRFMAVMFFAFPLGLFIKGRRLRSFFASAAVATPLIAIVIIFSIEFEMMMLLKISMLAWGVAFTCIQVTALPYILLNSRKENHSEAITLFFLSWSVTLVFAGTVNYLLNLWDPVLFNERNVLLLFSLMGFGSIYFVSKISKTESVTERIPWREMMSEYNWSRIVKVTVPTFIIAVGAGFTIPFISLFFENVHGMQSAEFSLMGASTYALVVIGLIFIPTIKRKFGYGVAITLIQSLSIFCLVMMATTEWYRHLDYAIYIAALFYVVRQPLMNVAGPMTSELTMYYVGDKNRELVSALNASIWSGSWFVSAQLFRLMREAGVNYSSIFIITAALYIAGVLWYAYLIHDYHRRDKLGLISI